MYNSTFGNSGIVNLYPVLVSFLPVTELNKVYDTFLLPFFTDILLTLLVIAIITTFHAAMRTFVTPLFMIIGVLKIKE